MSSAHKPRIPFAKKDDKWFTAAQAEKGGAPYTCGCCSEKVILKKGHKRRPHFSHAANSECGLAKGDVHTCETMQHRYAKHILRTTLSQWTFTCTCATCVSPLLLQWHTSETVSAMEEFRWNDGQYVLDVSIVEEDTAIAALEVLQTHAIGQEKRYMLEMNGLVVVEVSAADVIEAYENCTFQVHDVGNSQSLTQCAGCRREPRKFAAKYLAVLVYSLPLVVNCTAGHQFKWRWWPSKENPTPTVSKRGEWVRIGDSAKLYISEHTSVELETSRRTWRPPEGKWWTGSDAILQFRQSHKIHVWTERHSCQLCIAQEKEERRQFEELRAMRKEDPMFTACETGRAQCALVQGTLLEHFFTRAELWNTHLLPWCACKAHTHREQMEKQRQQALKDQQAREEKQRQQALKDQQAREEKQWQQALEEQKAREKVQMDRDRQEKARELQKPRAVAAETKKRQRKEKEEAERKQRHDLRRQIKSSINTWLAKYPFTFSEENLASNAGAVYDGCLHLKENSPHQGDAISACLEEFMGVLHAVTTTNGLAPPEVLPDDDGKCLFRFRIVSTPPKM